VNTEGRLAHLWQGASFQDLKQHANTRVDQLAIIGSIKHVSDGCISATGLQAIYVTETKVTAGATVGVVGMEDSKNLFGRL